MCVCRITRELVCCVEIIHRLCVLHVYNLSLMWMYISMCCVLGVYAPSLTRACCVCMIYRSCVSVRSMHLVPRTGVSVCCLFQMHRLCVRMFVYSRSPIRAGILHAYDASRMCVGVSCVWSITYVCMLHVLEDFYSCACMFVCRVSIIYHSFVCCTYNPSLIFCQHVCGCACACACA